MVPEPALSVIEDDIVRKLFSTLRMRLEGMDRGRATSLQYLERDEPHVGSRINEDTIGRKMRNNKPHGVWVVLAE